MAQIPAAFRLGSVGFLPSQVLKDELLAMAGSWNHLQAALGSAAFWAAGLEKEFPPLWMLLKARNRLKLGDLRLNTSWMLTLLEVKSS